MPIYVRCFHYWFSLPPCFLYELVFIFLHAAFFAAISSFSLRHFSITDIYAITPPLFRLLLIYFHLISFITRHELLLFFRHLFLTPCAIYATLLIFLSLFSFLDAFHCFLLAIDYRCLPMLSCCHCCRCCHYYCHAAITLVLLALFTYYFHLRRWWPLPFITFTLLSLRLYWLFTLRHYGHYAIYAIDIFFITIRHTPPYYATLLFFSGFWRDAFAVCFSMAFSFVFRFHIFFIFDNFRLAVSFFITLMPLFAAAMPMIRRFPFFADCFHWAAISMLIFCRFIFDIDAYYYIMIFRLRHYIVYYYCIIATITLYLLIYYYASFFAFDCHIYIYFCRCWYYLRHYATTAFDFHAAAITPLPMIYERFRRIISFTFISTLIDWCHWCCHASISIDAFHRYWYYAIAMPRFLALFFDFIITLLISFITRIDAFILRWLIHTPPLLAALELRFAMMLRWCWYFRVTLSRAADAINMLLLSWLALLDAATLYFLRHDITLSPLRFTLRHYAWYIATRWLCWCHYIDYLFCWCRRRHFLLIYWLCWFWCCRWCRCHSAAYCRHFAAFHVYFRWYIIWFCRHFTHFCFLRHAAYFMLPFRWFAISSLMPFLSYFRHISSHTPLLSLFSIFRFIRHWCWCHFDAALPWLFDFSLFAADTIYAVTILFRHFSLWCLPCWFTPWCCHW